MAIANQRITIPFIGGTKRSRSAVVNDQHAVNLMTAIKGEGAKAPRVLETVPGVVDTGTIGTGPIRTAQMVQSAIRGSGTDLYGVWGTKLIAQTTSTGNVEVGTLNTSTGQMEIAAGRNYVALVDGTNGYTYDGTTFAEITDLDFPSNATHIRYIDGFFIANDPDTDNWYLSALEDPTSWNALDFDAAAVRPDAATACETTESLVWIFGPASAQPYFNSGNPDFPYSLALEGVKPVGVLAPHSVAASVEGIFFLATTPQGGRLVYHLQGMAGQVVTGDEDEDLLQTVIDPTTAYGFIYKQAGKSFYCLQLGATEGTDARGSLTMVYNIKAQVWETRELQDGNAWRVGGVGVLGNKLIGGSRLGSRQLSLDLTNYQDSGEELIRRRRTQIYHINGLEMDWQELVIDVETGVGTGDGTPNEDPIMRLRYWVEAMGDWSDYLDAPLGKLGETFRRAVYHNLGQGRARKFEIVCSAAVPLTIVNAYARVEVLDD